MLLGLRLLRGSRPVTGQSRESFQAQGLITRISSRARGLISETSSHGQPTKKYKTGQEKQKSE
jgi:hypothetical protein